MFLLELNIEEEQWAEAEMNLLKFVYLYPQSSIYKQVISRGYSVLDEEKYFSIRDCPQFVLKVSLKTNLIFITC